MLPVLPANLRLLPVLPVTYFFNADNGLRDFQGVVTGVTYKMKREPEADRQGTGNWVARDPLPARLTNGPPGCRKVLLGVKGRGSNWATRSG